MNPFMLELTLEERFVAVWVRIIKACGRAGRSVEEVTLVAVTKTVSVEVASAVATAGVPTTFPQRGRGPVDLGENRPQELWKKAAAIPSARWHLIGHLQRNKIEKTVPLVTLIHSVDSERLLLALDEFGNRRGQPVPVLLEVNCSREEAKGGFRPEDVPSLSDKLAALTGVRIDGLMTMAAFHDDPENSRPTFAELRQLRDRLARDTGLSLPHLSMGMSNDFEVAIEEGATLVRIGTTLFAGLEEE